MHIFSVSHVLYPALYFAYFHVFHLDVGIIQGFIGPELCLGLCIGKNKQVVSLMQDFSASWQLGVHDISPIYTKASCQIRCIILHHSGKLSWRPDVSCKPSAGQALFHALVFVTPFYITNDSIYIQFL